MTEIKVELQEVMGSDAAIANAAWTSTYDLDRREEKYDDPAKVAEIVQRCVREGHSVPLESVVLRFWIRLPVFADRQHVTHRMASHNGLSGRYRSLPDDHLAVPDDVRAIMGKVVFPGDPGAARAQATVEAEAFDRACADAYGFYATWLRLLKSERAEGTLTDAEFKRAREFLRGVVPTVYMVERTTILNLLSFANYQRLRNSDHAQPEIRRVAELMLREVIANGVAPVALRELMTVGWTVGQANHRWNIAPHDPSTTVKGSARG